jgi:hypothetical protein
LQVGCGLVALVGAISACADGSTDLTSDLPRWTPEPEIRIGAVDDPDYAFGRVMTLEVGSDGSIYSLHRGETTIRRWTSDGRAAGGVGRGGEGPGEFTNPRDMGWHGDSLWVYDSRQYRISFFSPDGTYLASVTPRVDLGSRASSAAGVFPARPNSLLGDGSILAITPGPSHEIVAGRLTRIAYVRTSAAGDPLDTLTTIPVGPTTVLGVLRDGGGTFSSQPFGDDMLVDQTSDGMGLLLLERRAASEPSTPEFRLTRFDLAGDTVFSRGYRYEPIPLPRSRVDSASQAMAESLHAFVGEQTGTTLSQWEGWVGEAMYAPAHYPPISQMLMGRDGTVWLALNPPPADTQPLANAMSAVGGSEWLVLDEGGAPLARVRTPSGMRLLLADRTALWGVEQDALEVDYIVRYRLEAGDGLDR